MSPSIDVDDDVFAALKEHAEPLVDTANSVLRRLLGLGQVDEQSATREDTTRASNRRKRSGRAAFGTLMPESEYELPILRYLVERGGRAPSREVVDAVGKMLDDKLTHRDRQPLKSGDIRWENRAAFVRLRLVERGELVKGSPRGTWEITDLGRKRAQGLGSNG